MIARPDPSPIRRGAPSVAAPQQIETCRWQNLIQSEKLGFQAPVAKPCNFQIDGLGLYYPRQGQFLKCPVLQVIRFPMERLTRIAFDFLADFQFWRECSNPADLSTAWVQRIRNTGLRQVLMEVRPRIPWIVRALKATRQTKPIIIPEDFLLNR